MSMQVLWDFGNEDGLTRAALDRYAKTVLIDVFAILEARLGLTARAVESRCGASLLTR